MAEMSRENARQLFISRPPEEYTRILFEYKAKGESVFIDINGHKLYSCEIDSEDYVYQKLMGMSKAEYEKKLIEEEKENARKIEFYGSTLEECVNALLKFKSRGESVFVDFNGHKLYSCDITMDGAYQEVLGKTKAEFDKAQEEWQKEYEERTARKEAEAKAKIPTWIKKGETFIYPERMEEWTQCVEARASDLYHGMDLDAAIEIMEKLENGASLDEAKELLDSQDHSGTSYEMVRNIIFSFSKQGPEFWEHTAYGEISPEARQAIKDKKRENESIKNGEYEPELSYEEKKQIAESRIPEWIERGSKFIYPEKLEKWRKHVESSARGIFVGLALDEEIELMQRLEDGATFEELTQTINDDETEVYIGAVNAVLRFSRLGPEFTEYFEKAIGEYNFYRDKIEAQKKENAELDELHRGDSTKEVPTERRTEEQEITNLSEEKEQLTAEISDIEQQLEGLKAKEAELKKALEDKQSQLNDLEEK